MNAFADTIFTFLLGWIRGFTQTVFNAVSSPKTHGFFEWLGDHWLSLALILIACGVMMDFIIWMIRWQPYRLWNSWIHKMKRRVRGETIPDKTFTRGYTQGVEGMQTPAPPQENAVPQEKWTLRKAQAQEPPKEQPVWTRQLPYAQGGDQPQVPASVQMENTPQPASYEMPKPRFEESYVFEDEFKPRTAKQQPERRRRSDKHQRGITGAVNAVKSRLNAQDEDEVMLDGLPPVVSKEQAFHEPVYPQRDETGRYFPS